MQIVGMFHQTITPQNQSRLTEVLEENLSPTSAIVIYKMMFPHTCKLFQQTPPKRPSHNKKKKKANTVTVITNQTKLKI